MDVVVVSARGAAIAPHWSEAAARELAGTLVQIGHRVRWFRPVVRGGLLPPTGLPTIGPQVRTIEVPGPVPPFRRVQARTEDPALERELASSLRAEPTDWVLHFGYGAPGSASVPWLSARMGAATAAVVQAAEVLCHRGTLVDSTGAPCAEFADPVRCRRCCSEPFAFGMSPPLAALARWLSGLGWLAPMPDVLFQNRADSLVGGLLDCKQVIACIPADVGLLAAAGVPRRILSGVPPGAGLPAVLLPALGLETLGVPGPRAP
jgi:hypothetical protein